MKRMLPVVLLALLLCGCGNPPTQIPTTAATVETEVFAQPTEPRGIYVPFTDMEVRTEGAVRCYQPDRDDCYAVDVMGNDLLLFSGGDTTTLTRLTGENLYIIADTQLDCRIGPEDPSFQISAHGITFYDALSREVVFLDNDLKEARRLAVPAELTGIPVLSGNRMRLFYCTADAVRIYDLETGLDRLLKSMTHPAQTVAGILSGDRILQLRLTDERGKTFFQFISTETGELIREYEGELQVFADEENYFARFYDGLLPIAQFRLGQGEELTLTAWEGSHGAWFLPGSCRFVTVTQDSQGTALAGIDLASGHRTALVTLPEQLEPRQLCEDRDGAYVYLLALDTQLNQPVVLRWQPELTPDADETVFTGRRFTRDNPDTQGLEQCAMIAREMSGRYGIQILMGREAVANQPGDYILEEEYQVRVLRWQLNRLESCLAQFPEGFFGKLSGDKQILLVRSITGRAESGSVDAAMGLQFWNGDTACVALSAGEGMEGAFFHELFHIMDGKILSDTRTYYYWHNLNPEGFAYSMDYTSYQTQDLSAYLDGGNRAFIDAYSTTFPKEDRARIMEYACTPGNEVYFSSEIMQRKLSILCRGIRETFGLTHYAQPLLWEQYLNPGE